MEVTMRKNILYVLSFSAAVSLSLGNAAWAGESENAASLSASETAVTEEAPAEVSADAVSDAPADAPAEAPADAASGDAIDPASTSAEDPAKLGQWVNFAVYSTDDKAYHNLQVKIDRVYTYSDQPDVVDSAIALNNSLNEYSQIDISDMKLPSDVELDLVKYDVSIPADFPAGEFGLYNLDLNLSAQNPSGGGIPSADGTTSYIGLGYGEYLTTENFGDSNINFEAGKTYTAYAVFTMVKGYTDYVFSATTYPDGTAETTADDLIYVYFASNEPQDAPEETEPQTDAAEEETQLSAQEAADALQNALDAAD